MAPASTSYKSSSSCTKRWTLRSLCHAQTATCCLQVPAWLRTWRSSFGGFKSKQDLGFIMWMLSHAMDAGAQGNSHLMREYVALTVACIDQSNLDGHGSMAYTLSLLEEPPNQVFCDRDDSHWQTFLTAGPGSLGVDRSLFCEGAGGAEHKEAGDKDPKGQPKGRESTESHVTTEKTEVSQTSKGCARSAADSATVTPLQCGAVPDACSMPAP